MRSGFVEGVVAVILRFTRTIPSWFVGVSGAFIVVLSVTLGSVLLHDLDTNSNEMQAEFSELDTIADSQLRQHIIAESRAETADLIFGLAVAFQRGNRPEPFLLNRAGLSPKGAITTMWLSTPGTEKEDLEALSSTVDDLRAKLNGGDLAAYVEMIKILR